MASFSLRRFRRVTHPYAAFIAAMALLVTPLAPVVHAGPTGAQVIHGNVVITQNGNVYIIHASNKAIINYAGFNIAPGETVQFIQPHELARVLNRITGGGPTQIDGTLLANGIVYLVNPAGVIFGSGSVVDVGGLYAAAASISNAKFLEGVDRFVNAQGSVVNNGSIQGEVIHLIGKHVGNHGAIVADQGVITMLAGDNFLIGRHDGRIFAKVDGKFVTGDRKPAHGSSHPDIAAAPGVDNTGLIDANQGEVVIGAGDMYSLAVRNSGTIRAARGDIMVAALDGAVHNLGVITASTDQGQAGSVTVRGPSVVNEGAIRADSHSGAAGWVEVTSQNHTYLLDGSVVSAAGVSGFATGGNVLIHSYDGLTIFADQAKVNVSGGRLGGNAGFAEISGENLGFQGSVNLRAKPGYKRGHLLIDPIDITIIDDPFLATGDGLVAPGDGTVNFVDAAGLSITISNDALEAILGDITLQATRDIIINAVVDLSANNNNVTLEAWRHIIFNAAIKRAANLILSADADGVGGGNLVLNVPLAFSGNGTFSGEEIHLGGGINGVDINFLNPVILTSDIVVTGNDITFASTVNSDATARALVVNSLGGGITTFADFVGDSSRLLSLATNADGATHVAKDILTTGNLTFGDDVVLTGAGAQTLNAGDTLTADKTITKAAGDLFLNGGTLVDLNGAVSVGGDFSSSGGDFDNTGGAIVANDVFIEHDGDVLIGANITANGNDLVIHSGMDGTGNLTFGPSALAGGVIIQSDNITFLAGDGAGGMTTAFVDLLTNSPIFRGSGGAGTSPVNFTWRQDADITNSLTAAASQFEGGLAGLNYFLESYDGSITLSDASKFALSNLDVRAGINVNFNASFNGANRLASLYAQADLLGGGGFINLNGGTLRTDGDQHYASAVQLGANTTLHGVNIAFDSTVDADLQSNNRTLTVNASGTTTFGDDVGASQKLLSLTTDAAGDTRIGGDVFTTSGIIFNDEVELFGAGNQRLDAGIGALVAMLDLHKSSAGNLNLAGAAGLFMGRDVTTANGNLTFENETFFNGSGFDQVAAANGGLLEFLGSIEKIFAGSLNLIGDSGIEIAGNVSTEAGDLVFEDDVTFTGAANQLAAANGGTLWAQGALTKNVANLSLFGEVKVDLDGTVLVSNGNFSSTGGDFDNTGAPITAEEVSIEHQGDVLIGGNITATDDVLLIHSGMDGFGNLTFGAGVTLQSDLITLKAGDGAGGAGTGAFVDLLTNAPTLLGSGGAGTSPITLVWRQDADITNALTAAASQFGNGTAGLNYFIQSYDGSVTISDASKFSLSLLDILAGVHININAPFNGGNRLTNLYAKADLLGGDGIDGLIKLNGGAIVTDLDQQYASAVQLGANTTLSGVNVSFDSTVDADSAANNRTLTVNASGLSTFAGHVGSQQKLLSLTTDAAGTGTVVGGDVFTTAGIFFNDAVELNGAGAQADQRLDAGFGALVAKQNLMKSNAGDVVLAGDSGIFMSGNASTADGNLTFENDAIFDGVGNQVVRAGGAGSVLDFDASLSKITAGNLNLSGDGGIRVGLHASTDNGDLVFEDDVEFDAAAGTNQIAYAQFGKLVFAGDVNRMNMGNLNLHGDSGIELAGNAGTVDGDLTFENDVTFNGVGAQQAEAANGTLWMMGIAHKTTPGDLFLIAGTAVLLDDDVTVDDGSLDVTGDATLAGNVLADVNVTFNDALELVGGNQSVEATTGTLWVKGTTHKTTTGDLNLIGGTSVQLDQDVTVDDGSLDVTGDATVGGNVLASQDVTFNNNLELVGADQSVEAAAGTLWVKGTTHKTTTGDLELIGGTAVQLDQHATVDDGSLDVFGSLIALQDLSASDDITLHSTALLAGNVTAGDDITFADAVTFNGAPGSDQSVLAGDKLLALSTLTRTSAGDLILGGIGGIQLEGAVDIMNGGLTVQNNLLFNGSTITTSTTQLYQGIVTLGNDSHFTGTQITFEDAVKSQAGETNDLIITAGQAVFIGAVGNSGAARLGALSTSGSADIHASMRAQSLAFGGNVTLSGNALLEGTGFVDFNGAVLGSGFNLKVHSLGLAGNIVFGGNVKVHSLTAKATSLVDFDQSLMASGATNIESLGAGGTVVFGGNVNVESLRANASSLIDFETSIVVADSKIVLNKDQHLGAVPVDATIVGRGDLRFILEDGGTFAMGRNQKLTVPGELVVKAFDGKAILGDITTTDDMRLRLGPAGIAVLQLRERAIAGPDNQLDFGLDFVSGATMDWHFGTIVLSGAGQRPVFATPNGLSNSNDFSVDLQTKAFEGGSRFTFLILEDIYQEFFNDPTLLARGNTLADLRAQGTPDTNPSTIESILGSLGDEPKLVPQEPNITAAQRRQLAQLDIYTRDWPEWDRVVEADSPKRGRNVYDDASDRERLIATPRLPKNLVTAVLELDAELFGEEEDERNQRIREIQTVMTDVWLRFASSQAELSAELPAVAEQFGQFIDGLPSDDPARMNLARLRHIFGRLEVLGLNSTELNAPKSRILQNVSPQDLPDMKAMLQHILEASPIRAAMLGMLGPSSPGDEPSDGVR